MPLQVKAIEGSDDRYKILSIPFGGPLPGGVIGKDMAGEYFSPRTNLHPEIFPGDRPMLYDHGVDTLIKNEIIGHTNAKTMEQDELGWWVEAQLDRHGRYFKALKTLLDKGTLYGSTSAPAALVQKAADGEILDWPLFEQTLTPIPCNAFSRIEPAMARKHYEEAGLPLPAFLLATSDGAALAGAFAAAAKLDAVLSKAGGYNLHSNDVGASGAAAFAFVDADGRGHLPIGDAAHVRAALARFNQTAFPDDATKARAKAKLLAAAKKFGIDASMADGEKSARFLEIKAGQVLNRSNVAHAKAIHDHVAAMGASMGADWCTTAPGPK